MALDSVDDTYEGCQDEMANKQKKYLDDEKNMNTTFKEAWDTVERSQRNKKKKKEDPKILSKEQAIAIKVYTLDTPKIYPEFNNAVRTQGPEYTTSFRYHALHFFLTRAIQVLNARRKECYTGYRRVNQYFSTNVNDKIRFGSFTSSSLFTWPKREIFGDKSCFKIYTCLGADISLYSSTEWENEVLIPPYEVFKVTEIERGDDKNKCEVVYKVKSTEESQSNFKCALFRNEE